MSTTSSSPKKPPIIGLNESPPSPAHLRLRLFSLWVVTLAWAALIFYFSTGAFGSSFTAWLLSHVLSLLQLRVSPATFVTLHFLLRKLAHLTEYAIFGLLLYHCFEPHHQSSWHEGTALWAILAAAAYALSDELHQRFVSGRTASLVDSGIDTAGAAFGVLWIYGWNLMQGRRVKPKG